MENYAKVPDIPFMIAVYLIEAMFLGALLLLVVRFVQTLHYHSTAEIPNLYCADTVLNKAILETCPLLTKQKYYPTWYLFNGHLQTVMVSLMNDRFGPSITYDREILQVGDDGGIVSLDWAGNEPKSIDRPTALILHGLAGGSGEVYIRVIVQELLSSNWQVVVMNARGCGGTPLKSPQFFSAGYTPDLRKAVKYIRQKSVPEGILVGIGFSLGSNILTKYVGEEGDKCYLTAAVSVGNPFDLMETHRHMNRRMFNRYIYRPRLGEGLVNLGKQNKIDRVFADHPTVNVENVLNSKSVEDFDEHMTRRVFGYPTVRAYYRDASSDEYVQHIRIPTLLLQSLDDPICVKTAIPFDDCMVNPNTILCTTQAGGHLGFFQGNSWSLSMWSSEAVVEFCASIRDLVNSNQLPAKALKKEDDAQSQPNPVWTTEERAEADAQSEGSPEKEYENSASSPSFSEWPINMNWFAGASAAIAMAMVIRRFRRPNRW